MSGKTVGRHRVQWCNNAIQWTAVAADDEFSPWDRNAMWSYDLGGLTYFGFPFDPGEEGVTTTQRALNWLNRYHLILPREWRDVEPFEPVPLTGSAD